VKRLFQIAALAFFLSALGADRAGAFEYTTCGSAYCHWPSFPVGYLIGKNVEDLFDGATQAVEASFSRWNKDQQTFCGIELNSGGLTDTARATDDFDNVVFAQKSDWPYGPLTLAVTQCFYTPDGKLVDCDVVINAQDWNWTDGNPQGDTMNLRDTITHEAGHSWGMDHSDSIYATMYGTYRKSTVAADLDEDDIRGAAERYCEGEMPPDDGEEQNDSLQMTGNPFEEKAFFKLRLYDADVWRINVVNGRFPKMEITDRRPDRHKIVSVYDSGMNLIGSSPCDGDCVVAPARDPISTTAAFIKVETDFSKSSISAETYDLQITQVAEVDESELTDDDEEEAEDEDGGSGGFLCGGIDLGADSGPGAGSGPAAALFLFLIFWGRTARRRLPRKIS